MPIPRGNGIGGLRHGLLPGRGRIFWTMPGRLLRPLATRGFHAQPDIRKSAAELTGHAESSAWSFDPVRLPYSELAQLFWENHDPTQGMRQGNDVGTQYRSAIYTSGEAQRSAADVSREAYARALREARRGAITTEIAEAGEFFYAEAYHQQYLAKNPWGYCGIGGTGVRCPAPVAAQTQSR